MVLNSETLTRKKTIQKEKTHNLKKCGENFMFFYVEENMYKFQSIFKINTKCKLIYLIDNEIVSTIKIKALHEHVHEMPTLTNT